VEQIRRKIASLPFLSEVGGQALEFASEFFCGCLPYGELLLYILNSFMSLIHLVIGKKQALVQAGGYQPELALEVFRNTAGGRAARGTFTFALQAVMSWPGRLTGRILPLKK